MGSGYCGSLELGTKLLNLSTRGIEVCTKLLNFKVLVLELLQFNTLALEFLLELLYEQQKRGLVSYLCSRIRSGQVRTR